MAFDYTSQAQKEQIKDFTKEALTPRADLEKRMMAGVEQAGAGLMNKAPSLNIGGSENQALYSALEKRSRGDFDQALNKLKIQAGVDATNDRFNRLNQAASLVSAENDYNHQVRMAKKAMKENRRRARAGVIGNILGIAGAVGGAMIAPPGTQAMGGMAGYQIGQGAGQAFGGGI